MEMKCPECGGATSCLAGESAHWKNWYCDDEINCGWQAWQPKKAMSKFIEVPICLDFEQDKQVGVARIKKDAIPDLPKWVLSLGLKVTKWENGSIAEYELVQLGLIDDDKYRGYLGLSDED